MPLRKAARMSMKRKAVVLAVLILGVTAASALAANVSGDGTLVGSTGPDNITAGNQKDIVWGLGTPNGTTDNISAGNAMDTIDGGGHCTGVAPGDYRNGLPGSGSCEDGPTPPNCGTENISAGSGSDTVFGNCGPNNIALGSGKDAVYLYGGPNTVTVGNGPDTIDASHETTGPNTITTGSASDVVYAQNGVVDIINCGSSSTIVYADKIDKPSKKCTVRYTSAAKDRTVRRTTAHQRLRKATTHKKLGKAGHAR